VQLSSGLRLGPYEILAPIGEGGQAEVYRARDPRLQREVAIKIPKEHLARDPAALSRFEREARAIAALSHPNIIEIHDVGSDDGVTFVVMELLKGETLRQRLRGVPLSWRAAAELGFSIADGLAAAHSCGVIHRDLKPANVFLTSDGRVKILDFGLARLEPVNVEPLRSTTPTKTRTDAVLGTAGYMSPEQARSKRADARSDIFSLGCVLYEMITGRRAFTGETTAETLVAVLRDEPQDPADLMADLPEDLRMIILRSLAKDPEARFQSARDLAFALKVAGATPASRRSAPGSAPRPRRAVRLSGSIDSLAVLPFTNESGDPSAEYLSDGLAEGLIHCLWRLQTGRVLAWTTVLQYKGKNPLETGRALGVRAVLAGRVMRRGDSLVAEAELVDVRRGTRLWGEQAPRKIPDALAVEEMAREVSLALGGKTQATDERRLAGIRQQNPEAYDLYLKGRYQWNKRSVEGIEKSIGFFKQAIARDPTYAPAYAGLAGSYDLFAFYGIRSPREVLPMARDAAIRAIELDATIAEAHTSLAHFLYQFEWDFPAAEKEFRRAIEVNPNDPNAHQWYSNFLSVSKRAEESFEQIRLARRLDPLNLITYADAGLAFYLAGQHDRAIEELSQSLELEGNFYLTHIDLGLAKAAKGLFEQAMAEARTAMSLVPNDPNPISLFGYACARSGRRGEAEQALESLHALSREKYVSAFPMAFLYAGLGNKEKVFEWLEKAYEERAGFLVYLNVEAAFDSLRSEPRFQDLVRRMKLPA
jgi:serine/threonine protein kinase/tetratricopeptide (TPR) repeat protein